ncbi:hypothetical protein B0H14DRAFT_1687245 [Mycena olivaceomarginata]|nr:hypothetical protein B0H14DRAFT_1687245 [Mycena olivaceomarginata]
MASPPTPQALLGPYYFGVMLNTLLYGILVMQTVSYYQEFKKDKLWLRFFVLYLFVVESLNTGMCAAMIYEPLVGQFGTDSPTFLFPSLLPSQPFLEVAISVPVQFFYAWRISVLMRNYFVPALIGMSSLASMVGAIWTALIVHQVKNYANKSKVDTTALIWSCCASAADLIITVSLFWSLTRRKTGVKRTDDTIDSIARHAIQTGLLTVTFSLIDVTLFVVLPNSTLSFFFDFALPKLYSNALVSTLNARSGGQGGGIIELDAPTESARFTGSMSHTRRRTTAFESVTFAKSPHTVGLDSNDILALGGEDGSHPDPK